MRASAVTRASAVVRAVTAARASAFSLLPSLGAYYNLADVNDNSGNGNTLSNMNAVTFSTGAKSPASFANFVGASSQYLLYNGNLLFLNTNRSYCLWFNATAVATSQFMFAVATDAVTGPSVGIGINASKLRLAISGGTTAGTATLVSGRWYFVLVTWDKVNCYAYLNGSSTPDVTRPATVDSGNFSQTLIGPKGNQSAYFTGSIGGVGIWNGRVLSQAENAALYNGLQYSQLTRGVAQ